MKTHLLIGSCIVLGVIASCGDPGSTEKNTVEKRLPVELAESDIFNFGQILAYLQNDEKKLDEANTLFMQGLNAFRNKQNLDSADYYFRQSILKEPSGKAYFELGNVYMDKKSFDDALLAYTLAEQLDYQPLSKILYKKSCIYSLQKKTELSGKYLEFALQAGYNNLDHINVDSDLKELRASYHFQEAVKKGTRGMSDAENLIWLQFKKMFTKFPVPHKAQVVMDEKNLANLQYISYEYEKYIAEMRDDKFSREVSKGFYYYAQLYESEKYVALVYIVKDEFLGEFSPLTYRLATFTHDGKLIDKKDMGGRELLSDPIKQATFAKEGVIKIDILKPKYSKDPEQEGYYDNKILSYTKVGSMEYLIEDSGKIKLTKSDKKELAAN